jgi:hypothetical protein
MIGSHPLGGVSEIMADMQATAHYRKRWGLQNPLPISATIRRNICQYGNLNV